MPKKSDFVEKNARIDAYRYSGHPSIHRLIESIVDKLRTFTEEQAQNIADLVEIGKAMSAEHDLSLVLELILRQARRFTKADGGTLYLLSEDQQELAFLVMHNETLNTFMGGTSPAKVTLPNVPLYRDGNPNHANVCSFVALKNETVNIADVYEVAGFNFEGTKKFDDMMNYRSQSMLVVPMCDHEDRMIGVLQLINAQNADGAVIAFSSDVIDLTEALASQAAVMLTQQNLIENLKDLFEAFIKAIATAIEEKSKYTGGHIERVAELTMKIAEKINQAEEGPFADAHFSPSEMEELRIAAWMHDTGKIATAEHVVDKSMKLECVFDRMELVRTRWQAIVLTRQIEYEAEKQRLAQTAGKDNELTAVETNHQQALNALAADLAFLESINKGGEFLSDTQVDRLQTIAAQTYRIGQTVYPYLTADEVKNLSIRKGTLTPEERKTIEQHVNLTIKILGSLPWPKKLSRVPEIAGAHHEKLDGTGYPNHIKGDDISLQSRIMAVSDIFEALSALDRPYKNPMTIAGAIQVLNKMVKDNHLDEDVVDLLIQSGLIDEYAARYLTNAPSTA
jgi:HD-GYP domain-containing protein (c-di-GMP phosphodiesterase class II)